MDYIAAAKARTTNTDAAAALCALDIGLRSETDFERVEGGDVTFFFESASGCGQYQTDEMVRAWDDAEWQRQLPKHPLSYLRVFFRNRHRLRDHFERRVPLAAVWRQGKMELVTLRGGGRVHTEPMPRSPDGIATVRTDKEDLACALMACGVPLWAKRPWAAGPAGPLFEFHGISPCGGFRAAELALAWENEDWWKQHPEHPFSYVYCGSKNHEELTRRIRRKPPLVVIQKNGLPCMISANPAPEVERAFFEELKRL